MEKQVGSIVTSVLVALTFGFLLTALVTPGWFLFEFKTSSSSSSITVLHNAPSGQTSEKSITITTEVDIGPFFIRVCINDLCEQIDYEKLKSIQSHQAMPDLIELQVESIIALALCTISGLLVMIPGRSNSKRYRVAMSLMFTAVIIESILIYRMASANLKVYGAWDKVKEMKPDLADTSMEVKFPYSILIAGFGALFGISGCVSSAGMYGKSRDLAQHGQDLNVFPAAPTNGYTILKET